MCMCMSHVHAHTCACTCACACACTGQAFEYASGTTLDQPGGSVEGGFQMVSHVAPAASGVAPAASGVAPEPDGSGLPFDAAVDRFECIVADDAGRDTG